VAEKMQMTAESQQQWCRRDVTISD